MYHLDLDTINYYRIGGHPYNISYNREFGTFLVDLYFNLKVPTQFFFELFFFSPTYEVPFNRFYFDNIFLIEDGFNNFRKFCEARVKADFNLEGDYFRSRYREFFSGGVYNLSDVSLTKRSAFNLFYRVVKPNRFVADIFISLFQESLREDLLVKKNDLIVVYDKIRIFPFFNRARDDISFYLPMLYDKYRFWQKACSGYFLGFSNKIFDIN